MNYLLLTLAETCLLLRLIIADGGGRVGAFTSLQTAYQRDKELVLDIEVGGEVTLAENNIKQHGAQAVIVALRIMIDEYILELAQFLRHRLMVGDIARKLLARGLTVDQLLSMAEHHLILVVHVIAHLGGVLV